MNSDLKALIKAQPAQTVPELTEKLRLAGLTLIGLAEHGQDCDVFNLDEDGRHCACSCGYNDAIAVIAQAGKTAAPQPAQADREPSPTAGMSIAQRILHVGGRNNAAGYVEFGSVQAVEALVRQVLRDLPAAPQPEAQPQWHKPAQRLVQWLHCMSYNDSYFGEPAGYLKQCVNELKHLLPPNEVPAAPSAQAEQPLLTVRVRSFPESNGKRNWTALLVRSKQWGGLFGNCGGVSLARGECWNRVAYVAECAKLLIGERNTEPNVLDYSDDISTPEEWAGEVRGGRAIKTIFVKEETSTDHYRKKPVVIEALQWDGTESGIQRIKARFPAISTLAKAGYLKEDRVTRWRIDTLEGGHDVAAGDFIIKGVKGEFYPCKPDIFAMTYEPVTPSAQAEQPICGNCDEPAPGCGGLFASDGAVCKFHGKVQAEQGNE